MITLTETPTTYGTRLASRKVVLGRALIVLEPSLAGGAVNGVQTLQQVENSIRILRLLVLLGIARITLPVLAETPILFVTPFLGITSGVHPVEFRADPNVKSVRIALAGREIALLRQPPWKTRIDFGRAITPAEIVAVAYDAGDNEIGRTSQIINLPRPFADVSIVVKRESSKPVAIEVVGHDLEFSHPENVRVTLDGRPLAVEKFIAPLPNLVWTRPHLVSAEIRFDDGIVARRELVLDGGLSYTAGAQLSPVLVTGKALNLEGCFSADEFPLRTAGVERNEALVVIVKDPDAHYAQTVLRQITMSFPGLATRLMFLRDASLDTDTNERVVWPVAQQFVNADGSFAPSTLFEWTGDTHKDLVSVLSSSMEGTDWFDKPRRFTDAVAVAGLQTLMKPQRRAVSLLLSQAVDSSELTPTEVRRYLATVGVPIFVWSLSGPRPELESSWGSVIDISRRDKFHDAVIRVRKTLGEQKIVWLPVDPVTALRVQVKPSCGVTTVAKSW